MKPIEVLEECIKVLKHKEETGALGKVGFVVPEEASGNKIRLQGRGSPLGHVVCCTEHGTTAYFDANEVIIWLLKKGLVTMKVG